MLEVTQEEIVEGVHENTNNEELQEENAKNQPEEPIENDVDVENGYIVEYEDENEEKELESVIETAPQTITKKSHHQKHRVKGSCHW